MCVHLLPCAYVCLCADTLPGKQSHRHSQASCLQVGEPGPGGSGRGEERGYHAHLLKMEMFKCISNPIQYMKKKANIYQMKLQEEYSYLEGL